MRDKKNRQAFIIIVLFVLLTACYGVIQRTTSPKVIIRLSLDDMIPFCEWFAIPYVLWHGWVFVMAMLFLWKERDTFVKMGSMMVLGLAVCTAIFALCPNGIDFRPETFPRDNLLVDLVKFLYQTDEPENVFPSIHVLHSLTVFAAVHHSPMLRRHRWVEPVCGVLAVLICLSTVFIKQHSVVDIVGAMVLDGVLYLLIFRRKRKTDEVTV